MIPISPNPDEIRNYVELRLYRDSEPEAMSNDLRADIVRVILEMISDTGVRLDHPQFSALSIMCT